MAKTQTNKKNLLEIAAPVRVGSFREMGVEVGCRRLLAAAYSFQNFLRETFPYPAAHLFLFAAPPFAAPFSYIGDMHWVGT